MSFNDIANNTGAAVSGRKSSNALTSLSNELKELQSSFVRLKDVVSKIQRKPISSVMKASIDEELKRLRMMESRMKNQTDIQQKKLETLPRAEIAQRRVALGKLTKDFERIKLGLNQLSQETLRLRVDDAMAEANGTTDALGSGLGLGSGSVAMGAGSVSRVGNTNSVFRMDGTSNEEARDTGRSNNNDAGRVQFQQVIKGEQIDDLLAEEREKEILKMNQDLKMVNEMFKDMAEIVQDQNGMIQQVSETTENANSRAKEGLRQVEQAAGYQSSCTIS